MKQKYSITSHTQFRENVTHREVELKIDYLLASHRNCLFSNHSLIQFHIFFSPRVNTHLFSLQNCCCCCCWLQLKHILFRAMAALHRRFLPMSFMLFFFLFLFVCCMMLMDQLQTQNLLWIFFLFCRFVFVFQMLCYQRCALVCMDASVLRALCRSYSKFYFHHLLPPLPTMTVKLFAGCFWQFWQRSVPFPLFFKHFLCSRINASVFFHSLSDSIDNVVRF